MPKQIRVLDPVRTHVNNPECPMRLAPSPDHRRWYCIDCGFDILWTRLDIEVLPPFEPVDPGCPVQVAIEDIGKLQK